MIGSKKKIVFVHIPKTGGSSVAWALRKEFDRPNPLQRSLKSLDKRTLNTGLYPKSKFQPLPVHAKATDYVQHLGDRYWAMHSLAFVRNPFDLQISLFSYIQQTDIHPLHNAIKDISFREFIIEYCGTECSPNCQSSYVLDPQDRCIVGTVGRLENLNADFRSFCSEIGVNATLDHENKSKRSRRIAEYYDPELTEMVINAFRPDFDLLGYSTDPHDLSYAQMKLAQHPRLQPHLSVV
ncbi:sulfotransferase family 2 domain-containing protein [Ruegeria lacuscaerulensis]|uniref:sulfotransferase family 2 domain-containing protein n=1 Tax=Ruegeria lacuscaerulensis TaxID=55218 RepID=UPI00147EB768|nr:sulfotransferase family 2 domain-containing protein [Ruegeria lacuscaerulensis]